MRALRPEQLEVIDALVAQSALGSITAGLLEKDEHLTDALRALFALRLDGMHFAFCGGTSLSKAHGLIERMSEDADLKIVLDAQTPQLSRAQLRKRLSGLKSIVSQTLAGIGLVEDTSQARALNENRYFCSEWTYARHYASVAGLRPHLQIELPVRAPVLSTELCWIGSLADQLAGRQDHTFAVATVAVAETVAEKILSFLRRYAQHRARLLPHDWDTALVRHIYDVHCAHVHHPDIVVTASQAFAALVAGDQKEFGGQFPDFATAALPVLYGALRQAGANPQIQDEYTGHLLPLIYGHLKPDFAEAFAGFEWVALALLATLDQPSIKA
ncbi:nucleotidyl transferase AbiEii/AbiGii toxin family protein [Polaromonas glacialis]|uniref:nucleotidyl transferase AbiEii/AbiGii toxin family protein n=1 Tax=Polaromonas glacialis TaxID=866564 RepID=UPI0004977C1C|nr:nucleotidyl transferase AbiEii/AbiGii toxin family protein [Polaromonas glacialis]